jgi:hypothetical protein
VAWIHVQRDNKHSTADSLRVTVNVASNLDVLDAHGHPGWGSRIGRLLPIETDQWWEIGRDRFDEDAEPLIAAVVEIGAPEAIRRTSPARMLTIWGSGRGDPFEHEFYRYYGMAILLRHTVKPRDADDVRNLADEALEHAAVSAAYAGVPEWRELVDAMKERFKDPMWRPEV